MNKRFHIKWRVRGGFRWENVKHRSGRILKWNTREEAEWIAAAFRGFKIGSVETKVEEI